MKLSEMLNELIRNFEEKIEKQRHIETVEAILEKHELKADKIEFDYIRGFAYAKIDLEEQKELKHIFEYILSDEIKEGIWGIYLLVTSVSIENVLGLKEHEEINRRATGIIKYVGFENINSRVNKDYFRLAENLYIVVKSA